MRELLEAAAGGFLLAEWANVVDAFQLQNWEAYRDVQRLGRRTRLSDTQRAQAWAVFAGDLGQRIFQQPFSWKALGVDVRGRSRTLRINYRTSHQIRREADRLLDPELGDVDGNKEDRRGAISVFGGPEPAFQTLADETEECRAVAQWLAARRGDGLQPHEIGVFVCSAAQMPRALAAVEESGLPYRVLDEHVEPVEGHIAASTMHLAKGLEFRAVAVMACDDEVIPLQERIETAADPSELEEVYHTELQDLTLWTLF